MRMGATRHIQLKLNWVNDLYQRRCALSLYHYCCSFYRAMHYSLEVLRSHIVCLSVCPSVCLSVTLVDRDHIGWKSWKLTARTISETYSLFVAQRSSTYSQGNMEKFWGRKRSFNTYVHNVRLNWVNRESRDLRWRCDCSFTFFGASRGHLCDSTAFLFCSWYTITHKALFTKKMVETEIQQS